jgi:dTDP-4-amino-4,6-dideoxygalactose transaminase
MREAGYGPEGCPEAVKACEQVFSLPVFATTTAEDIDYIAFAIRESITELRARA